MGRWPQLRADSVTPEEAPALSEPVPRFTLLSTWLTTGTDDVSSLPPPSSGSLSPHRPPNPPGLEYSRKPEGTQKEGVGVWRRGSPGGRPRDGARLCRGREKRAMTTPSARAAAASPTARTRRPSAPPRPSSSSACPGGRCERAGGRREGRGGQGRRRRGRGRWGAPALGVPAAQQGRVLGPRRVPQPLLRHQQRQLADVLQAPGHLPAVHALAQGEGRGGARRGRG